MKRWRLVLVTVGLGAPLMLAGVASAQPNNPPARNLAERVAVLEAKVQALEAILQFVRVEPGVVDGLAGPNWIIEGANVHVRSGAGATDDGGGLTGLGNLVVGYNGDVGGDQLRTGSHNLVVGDEHDYTSFGGFVAGKHNSILAPNATVSGGTSNEASGTRASVAGGQQNVASGTFASVAGGTKNLASDTYAAVGGGHDNEASGVASVVSGGSFSEASGERSAVSGGVFSQASARESSVSGGYNGIASGVDASVSGGVNSVASGAGSSVSGGSNRSAPGPFNWRGGNLLQGF